MSNDVDENIDEDCLEYFKKLEHVEAFDCIYQEKWGCCAIYRILPNSCQSLITNFILSEDKTPLLKGKYFVSIGLFKFL